MPAGVPEDELTSFLPALLIVACFSRNVDIRLSYSLSGWSSKRRTRSNRLRRGDAIAV